MRILISIIATFFYLQLTYCQIDNYLQDGAEWKVKTFNAFSYPDSLFTNTYVYYLNGDSSINGINYKKLFSRGISQVSYIAPYAPPVYSNYDSYITLLRQDNYKIYIRTNSYNGNTNHPFIDTLLYNFDLQVGQNLPIAWNQAYDSIKVTGIDSILIGTSYRKKIHINFAGLPNNYDSLLIEGVGHSGGLLENFIYPWNSSSNLECFAINQIPYYPESNDVITYTCELNLSIPDFSQPDLLNFYPNPTTNQISIQVNPNFKIGQIQVINIIGETIKIDFNQVANETYSINLSDFQDGLYFVELQEVESGKSIRFKVEKNTK